jgi:hypothetical protein
MCLAPVVCIVSSTPNAACTHCAATFPVLIRRSVRTTSTSLSGSTTLDDVSVAVAVAVAELDETVGVVSVVE